MTPKEHIDQAEIYLARATAMEGRYGACVESQPGVNVLAALALAHATTAQAQLMALESVAS